MLKGKKIKFEHSGYWRQCTDLTITTQKWLGYKTVSMLEICVIAGYDGILNTF